ncbi:MAG: isoleucine-tRNA ligase [Microbacterium sp.]|nr:isoleucine-tRNA ligase [Microbacterium sp.]
MRARPGRDWASRCSTEQDGVVTVDGIALEPGEYELTLEAGGVAEGTAIALLSGGGFVLLDTTTTPQLEAEGLARDVIRAVQDTRKAAGFEVSDRIRLGLTFDSDDDAAAVASAFEAADVAGETLAREWAVRSRSQTLATSAELAAEGSADFEAVVAAKTYANQAGLTVSVTRLTGENA